MPFCCSALAYAMCSLPYLLIFLFARNSPDSRESEQPRKKKTKSYVGSSPKSICLTLNGRFCCARSRKKRNSNYGRRRHLGAFIRSSRPTRFLLRKGSSARRGGLVMSRYRKDSTR